MHRLKSTFHREASSTGSHKPALYNTTNSYLEGGSSSHNLESSIAFNRTTSVRQKVHYLPQYSDGTDHKVNDLPSSTNRVVYGNARNSSNVVHAGQHTPTTEKRTTSRSLRSQRSWDAGILEAYESYGPAIANGAQGRLSYSPQFFEFHVYELEKAVVLICQILKRLQDDQPMGDREAMWLERTVQIINTAERYSAEYVPDTHLALRFQDGLKAVDTNMTVILQELTIRVVDPLWEWLDDDTSFEDESTIDMELSQDDSLPQKIVAVPTLREALSALSKLPAPGPIPGPSPDLRPATLPPDHQIALEPLSVAQPAPNHAYTSLRRATSILDAQPGWR